MRPELSGADGIMDSMLIRRRSRQDVTEARWRADVTAKLDLLMNAQAQMAEATTLQLRDRQRPGRVAWIHATLLLAISALVVFNGILAGTAATSVAADAGKLQTLANSAMAQVNKAVQPVITLVNRKGAKWVVAHATKAEVADVDRATQWAKLYHTDSALASADQRAAGRYQLEAPALLAFGSALCGAVLGWMLTQWFGSLRWPKKHQGTVAT